jgi:UDP:flavonoid glycosyltransferase YjiC (YdhE family)
MLAQLCSSRDRRPSKTESTLRVAIARALYDDAFARRAENIVSSFKRARANVGLSSTTRELGDARRNI